MIIFYAFAVAFFSALMLIPPLTRLAYQRQVVDQPGERKVHETSLPRIGGLAIFLAFLFSSFLFVEIDTTLRGIYIGMFIILGVGLFDDLQGLTPKWKLLGQSVAAGFPVFFSQIGIGWLGIDGIGTIPPWAMSVFSLLVIVAITNAINLSDGLDGLAGGITLLCIVAMGLLAYRIDSFTGELTLVVLLMALAGALLGFLKYNTYPATIFMGDTGSLFLGFSAITLTLYLMQHSQGLITPAHALLVFAVPIVDTLWVMGSRVARGVSPFTADRNHLHHRLMDAGFSHKEVVTIIYAMATVTAMLSFALFKLQPVILYGVFALIAATILVLLHALKRSGTVLRKQAVETAIIAGPAVAIKSFYRYIVKVRSACHSLMKYLIIAILIVPAFLLPEVPRELGVLTLGFAGLLLGLLWVERNWADGFLHFTIYFATAVILMVNNFHPLDQSVGGMVLHLQPYYNGMFVLLAALIAFEIFIVRKTEILLATPLEFFILVIALVVPFLPEGLMGPYKLGAVGIKAIALFLGYKVLFLKTIKKNRRTIITLIVSSLIIGARGIAGW